MGKKKKETKEKPLDKMTAKELREVGKQIPEITGVYGMNKPELISAISMILPKQKTPRFEKLRKKFRN